MLAHLDGDATLAETIARVQTRSRQFAKRQITWFRREPDVQWLEGFGDDEQIQSEAIRLLNLSSEA